MDALYYLFGGANAGGTIDELWSLNLDSVAWTSKTLELPGAVWERKQSAAGLALRGHRCAAYKSLLLLFGGAASDGSCSNQLTLYDTQAQ